MFGPERTRRLPLTLGVLIALGCASCDDDSETDIMQEPSVTDPQAEEDAGEAPDEEEEEPDEESPDEEEEEDAGTPVSDAGAPPPSKDAGMSSDASVDAGSKPDAGGTKPDASTDAGAKPDASGSNDSGAKPDAETGGNEAFLRGEELVADNACGSCHQENFAGTAFYPNITPDVATGIGGWTDAQIIAAITMGKGHDGARLCALMQRYSFTEAELADLLAYLRGIPAIENEIDSVCPGHGK